MPRLDRLSFWLLLMVALSVATSGCTTPSLTQVCLDPSEVKSYEDALETLRSEDGRAIASEGGGMKLPVEDRETWEEWAHTRLEQTQKYMDYVAIAAPPAKDPAYPTWMKLRTELSRTADSLVQFYGYAHQGRAEGMSATLRRARTDAEAVRHLACDAAPIKK